MKNSLGVGDFPSFDPHQGRAIESLTCAVNIDAPCIGEEGDRLLDPPAPGSGVAPRNMRNMRNWEKKSKWFLGLSQVKLSRIDMDHEF